jgi:hypothetical protein
LVGDLVTSSAVPLPEGDDLLRIAYQLADDYQRSVQGLFTVANDTPEDTTL